MALDGKRGRFVEEYLVDLNATRAAIRAGYSARSAEVTGHRLLRDAKIADAISNAQRDRSRRTELTVDRVLLELGRIGLSDIRGAFTDKGSLLPPEEWTDDFAASVAAVEVISRNTNEKDEDGRTVIEHVHKVRLWDKNSALEKIGKHLAMFIDRHEHTGKGGGPLFPPTIAFVKDED
ncbi:terminase small subunit [Aureimonas fodinaquatilis]|uniref:Terminase small subunit n=1 Tax=Aureimonas fodinaquatilis TaxID=2565783 RepID=A0A5B0DVD3_9HYPH|nr:terminase small subunit [Aureimonas fodinaquatilis]KAA0970298.1 terminase small subunit [Aureimonas fodinaquatilis]